MEVEVISDVAPHTDAPRGLTLGEAADIIRAGRLEGIKLHRQWTHSTLRAAVRAVDAVLALQPHDH